jgi:hypothetical protein
MQVDPGKFFAALQVEFSDDPVVPFLASLSLIPIKNTLASSVVTGSRFVCIVPIVKFQTQWRACRALGITDKASVAALVAKGEGLLAVASSLLFSARSKKQLSGTGELSVLAAVRSGLVLPGTTQAQMVASLADLALAESDHSIVIITDWMVGF